MKLKCHRFDLLIEPLSKAGPEGWLHFQVVVTVPGFSGNFKAELQLEDLERFKDSLNQMEERIGKEHEAFWRPHKPQVAQALLF